MLSGVRCARLFDLIDWVDVYTVICESEVNNLIQ